MRLTDPAAAIDYPKATCCDPAQGEACSEGPRIRLGSVVRLASGSPPMTVGGACEDGSGDVWVFWYQYDEAGMCRVQVPIGALVLATN